jgi:release factor glutamine methyltransferase
MKIKNILQKYKQQTGIEILLAHVLKKTRTYLHTYPDYEINQQEINTFQQLLKRHIEGEPIAYILGHKAFWNLELIVTPDTLIPRPETELIIELILEKLPTNEEIIIADLGTGSGAIALALAKERPHWQLHATDQSVTALKIAQQNAEHLQISNVKFYQGNWCKALPSQKYHAIVSNPPYIAENDTHLNQAGMAFEPQTALVSGRDGLDAIRQIISQAPDYLLPKGLLVLEHGFDQAEAVRTLMQQFGYQQITSHRDLAGHERVVCAWH